MTAAELGPVGPEVDPTPARHPSPDIRLEGRHVVLVRADPDRHAPSLYRAAHGPDRDRTWRYLREGPFPDVSGEAAYLARLAAGPDPLLLAICDRVTGEAVGHASFMRMDLANRVGEIGNVMFGSALGRSPGGTEAIALMLRHGFETLGFRRLEWKCDAFNAASRSAALRYGFAFEGIFRHHMIVRGRSRDTAWFAMLGDDWPARRQVLDTWLASTNFDETGRQRLALSVLNATAIPAHAVRRAGADDVADFDALQRAAYSWNRQMLGTEPVPLLTPSGEVLARYETWLMEQDGVLVGALALEPHPDHLVIWSVSASPERQNAGIGRKLLEAAETRTRQLGLDTLRLFTGAPLVKNIDWYGRRGYATERIEDLPDRRLVHMIKRL